MQRECLGILHLLGYAQDRERICVKPVLAQQVLDTNGAAGQVLLRMVEMKNLHMQVCV